MTNARNPSEAAGRSGRAYRRPVTAHRVIAGRDFFNEFKAWHRATVDQRQLWAHCAAVAAETIEHNRTLIARHPDLADQVVELYGMQRYDQWSGYMPPALLEPNKDSGYQPPNRSPYRQAVVEIVAEATRREAAA